MSTIIREGTLQVIVCARAGDGLSLPGSPFHGKKLAFRSLDEARTYIEDSQSFILECQPANRRNEIVFDLDIVFANGIEWSGVFRADCRELQFDLPESGTGIGIAGLRPQYLAESVQRSLENEAEFSKNPAIKERANDVLRDCKLDAHFVGADIEFDPVDAWKSPDLGKLAGMTGPSSNELQARLDTITKGNFFERSIQF